jgi:hypothetical protein
MLMIAVSALFTATAAAGAQSDRREESLSRIADASLRAQVRLLADSARTAGLPDNDIIQRALLGQLRRADNRKIIDASVAVLARLRESRTALGTGATGEEISAGAMALGAGANQQTLARVAAERNQASLLVSLAVLSDLMTDSVPVRTAEQVVTRLTIAGARDGDLTSYRKLVRGDIDLGAVPTAAATTRAEAAIRGGFLGVTDALKNAPANRPTAGRIIPPPEN